MFEPIKASIKNIIVNTFNTKTFVLKMLNSPKLIAYSPGQYLILSWQNQYGATEKRAYSISKWDAANKECYITIKRIENGAYSRHLHDKAQIGDQLTIDHIAGFFTLPDNIADYKQLFFIIAGSGIAPVMPMIEFVLSNHPAIKIELIYSNKQIADTIFYKLLNTYQDQYAKQFTITYLFSQSDKHIPLRLNNSLLSSLVNNKLRWEKHTTLFYTCGPLEYMDMVSIALLTEGIPKANIKKEIFYNEIPEILASPPDKKAHKVTLLFSNKVTYSFTVQYPSSILDTALLNGYKLPYSCRSGQCGSCTGKCIQGEVFMSYNEVLTEKDIAQGYTLTCTGFPINGDVIIEF